MKKLLYLCMGCILPAMLTAQCGAGTSQAELNWDHIDFLPSNNTRYTSFYPNSAFPYSQNFSIGTRKMNMTMAPQANITLSGENTTNGAHGGSPDVSAGADVEFTTTSSAATTITFTFDEEVQNLRFSLFDLDNSQRASFTATNAAATAQNITVALANGTSGIALSGTATNRIATAPSTGYGNTDTRGAINITIAGPVLQVVITLSNATGNIWLSDIDACVTGTFPDNYREVSRPFTGQAQYVLTVVNNNIYYTNPTNGQSYFLFNEPAHNRLNSMAYDPYRRRVFYTFSLTGGSNPVNDKTVRMYDVDSKTISILIPDVNTFGIPTYENGVESGAASFYNGSLYLGIEGYTGESYAASRKSTVWRIDFDASGNPIAPASQVWGVLADNGTDAQNIHDWSDFAVVDGKLVDFDGSGSGDYDYYHFDLMTGVQTEYTPVGAVPRQVSVGWDDNIYNVNTNIGMYNGTTGTGTQYTNYAPLGPTIPTSGASWGDAAGPYRPFLDFGDAPASYDPDPLSPACHDTLTPTVSGTRRRMILGAEEDVEWLKRGFTTVEDNFEDGLSFVPILSPVTGTYTARVSVYNNCNTNATLLAWLDMDGNGLFDPSEAITPITVPSSWSAQEFDLVWPTVPNILLSGSYTYLRIRITRSSYGMDANDATGYYDMGEVEDYQVVVDNMPLSTRFIAFEASLFDNNAIDLQWQTEESPEALGYELERSVDGRNWASLQYVEASGQHGTFTYQYIDRATPAGQLWYRIRLKQLGGPDLFSAERRINRPGSISALQLFPNPSAGLFYLQFTSVRAGQPIRVQVFNAAGALYWDRQVLSQSGPQNLPVPEAAHWPAGVYLVVLYQDGERLQEKLLLR
jgi:hypothetical protein